MTFPQFFILLVLFTHQNLPTPVQAQIGRNKLKTNDFISVSRILNAPNGLYEFEDGRKIRATAYPVGGCRTYGGLRTGSAFPGLDGNHTAISMFVFLSYWACREWCLENVVLLTMW